MKRPSTQIGLGIALGAGIGAAITIFLGTGVAWLAIGIAIGVVIGAAMTKTKIFAGSHGTGGMKMTKKSKSPPCLAQPARQGRGTLGF